MPRERRQAVQSNAAMYVGYADDDEDVDSIMKKFKALEEAKKKSGGGDELGRLEGFNEADHLLVVRAVGRREGVGLDVPVGDGEQERLLERGVVHLKR